MTQLRYSTALAAALVLLSGCDDSTDVNTTATNFPGTPPPTVQARDNTQNALAAQESADAAPANTASSQVPFIVTEVTQFEFPWAMTFLPDGRLLVTEMGGALRLYDIDSDNIGTVDGVPAVNHVAQGGLGDVVLHPQYDENQLVYISYVEIDDNDLMGAVLARARLALDNDNGGALEDLEVIWRQTPKKESSGHFGYRIAFDDDGMLWISSSERQEFDPAQEMDTNLGKIVRLNDDGSVPESNPFADQGEIAAQVWSLGHRNILGMAFDAEGRLWAHEMGPKGGDELNLIEKGANYGYPLVSNGIHYDDTPIPDHDTRPEFNAPIITWTPVISPAGFIIYDGDQFSDWQGNGLVGGLSSMALVRIEFDGDTAREAERFDMERRIREVEQGPDGAIWLLEDGTRDRQSSLLKLTPTDQ